MKINNLKKTIENSIKAKKSLFLIEDKISLAISEIFKRLSSGGKIFLCGNGGSAADAQHLAAEFLVRLNPKINRKPIPAISLALSESHAENSTPLMVQSSESRPANWISTSVTVCDPR